MTHPFASSSEWIETDGLGGFSSGTAGGIRTRRYHALLLAAATPPTGRFVLVNGLDAWIETPDQKIFLSSQKYNPNTIFPNGWQWLQGFEYRPWPVWQFVKDGYEIHYEIVVQKGSPVVCLSWKLISPKKGVKLYVRPLMSGRSIHDLHHQNSAFQFLPKFQRPCITWTPYQGVPSFTLCSNGEYRHDPDWFENFFYEEESRRGLDCVEDLATPGIYTFDLSRSEAVLLMTTADYFQKNSKIWLQDPLALAQQIKETELKRRGKFLLPLYQSADDYLVKRGNGKTIIAGYPWFGDWGRDTFISMRGLCLAVGRFDEAKQILLQWADSISQGMLPNRFPDQGEQPEYNSVDASLWFIIAIHDFFDQVKRMHTKIDPQDQKKLEQAVQSILEGYSRGTRYGIHQDADGLLAAGEQGVQLTWMDAKIGDWVVTPRIGKPVEVQALWINALWFAAQFSKQWQPIFEKAIQSFRNRFWNARANALFDVIDVNHHQGVNDATIRPNQIFAVGGLPLMLLNPSQAFAVVKTVYEKLWTPMGLRSLAPGEPGYCAHYQGSSRERDSAYHQGTAWPWLAGPFVEAWIRVYGNTLANRRQAAQQFLEPLALSLNEAGLGHVSEIADAESPFTPRGCPFQAWSLGEFIRLTSGLLKDVYPSTSIDVFASV